MTAHSTKALLTIVIGSVIALAGSSRVCAEEPPPTHPLCPICKKANRDGVSYADHVTRTLARGALNAGLGWTELIRQPANEAKKGGNALIGIANGVGAGMTRTVKGLGEILTFWAPKVQGEYIHFVHDCPLDAAN